MIEFKNTNKTIDVTFRVSKSRTWYRFIFTKEGISKFWYISFSGGTIKAIKLKCEECNNFSCFCASKFKDFYIVYEGYSIEKEQYEKRRFQNRKNDYLRSVK